MRMTVELVAGYCGLQAEPLFGKRKHGISPGGPFDTESSRIANALAFNDDWAPVLELGSATATLRFDAPTLISIVGGGHVAFLEDKEIGIGLSVEVQPEQPLIVRPTLYGFRAYLSIQGGIFATPGKKWAFQSKLVHSVVKGRKLANPPSTIEPSPLLVIGSEALTTATVTAAIDRTGLRLDSQSAGRSVQSEISRPVVAGAIQMTPNSQYLVHGPDGPTIGGYDLAGIVARADLNKMGQLRPGQTVSFQSITVEEARLAYQQQEERLQNVLAQIRASAK